MPISRPAVSRHLRLLKDAGLVAERAQGTNRIYHLQEQGPAGHPELPRGRLGGRRRPVSAAGREHRDRHRTDDPSSADVLRCRLLGRARVRRLDDRGSAPGGRPTTPCPATPSSSSCKTGSGVGSMNDPPMAIEYDWGEVTVWRPAHPALLPLASRSRPCRRHRGRDPIRPPRCDRHPNRNRTPGLGTPRNRQVSNGASRTRPAGRPSSPTISRPWRKETADGSRHQERPVGSEDSTRKLGVHHLPGCGGRPTHPGVPGRLHDAEVPAPGHRRPAPWLAEQDDWVPLGAADEKKPAAPGTVEAWGRSPDNPVGGWYGLRSGYRGRFGMYLPPLLEELGLAELTHESRNNRMRARPGS